MRLHTVLLLMLLCALAVTGAKPKCDRSLITGVADHEIRFDYDTKILACVSGKKSLMAIKFNSKSYESLACNETEGWTNKDKEKVADASSPLNITCVKYCPVDGKRLHISIRSGERIEVRCDQTAPYLYFGKNLEINEPMLTCDFERGWYGGDYETIEKDTTKQMKFKCRKDLLKCDRRLIRVPDEEIHFDNDTKTLTCVNEETSLMAIKFNSKRYESLACNETEGWTTLNRWYNGTRKISVKQKVADASSILDVSCVEYCMVEGRSEGLKIEIDSSKFNGEYLKYKFVTCEESYLYFGKNLDAYGNFVTCDLDLGWHDDLARIDQDVATPMQFECRKDPPTTTSKPTTPTTKNSPSNITREPIDFIVTVPPSTTSQSAQAGDYEEYYIFGGLLALVVLLVVAALLISAICCTKDRQEHEIEGNNEDGSDSVSSEV